jgi:hypothetical protein
MAALSRDTGATFLLKKLFFVMSLTSCLALHNFETFSLQQQGLLPHRRPIGLKEPLTDQMGAGKNRPHSSKLISA